MSYNAGKIKVHVHWKTREAWITDIITSPKSKVNSLARIFPFL